MYMMKKVILIIIVVFISNIHVISGQAILKNNKDLIGYNNIPQEGIFVHYNTNVLFSGEVLYYSVFCLNTSNDKLSSISKIAYVELVGEHGELVFKHKITLNYGTGQGEFLIPTSVSTGNYKLISYTRWMKNGGQDNYFQEDIYIINPYFVNQKEIVNTTENVELNLTNPEERESLNEKKNIFGDGNFINVSTDKNIYKKRSQVFLTLKNSNGDALNGVYSLSVRKKDGLNKFSRISSKKFISSYKTSIKNEKKNLNDSFYLPELRGELISGTLLSIKNNSPAIHEKILFSIPGKEHILKIANTNKEGKFYINISNDYDKSIAVLQVLGKNKEDFKIVFDTQLSIDAKNLIFNKINLNASLKDLIIERSIFNQIENTYFSVKPDTIKTAETIIPFCSDFNKEYFMDDYAQFSSVKEVLVEIIKDVWIVKNENDEYVFHVRSPDPNYSFTMLPWVIVDGILLQDHSDILGYDSKKINKISVSRNKHLYGSGIFEGLIVIETKTGDFISSYRKEYITNFELFKPLPVKKYFNQIYRDDNTNDRIPDFRYQLLWKPRIEFNQEEMTIDFFTSDIVGDFEISLDGFTSNGQAVSILKVFKVE